ncbi:hypothetical protein HYC85_010280 [Camellia sinensis]|uniref:Nuclear pore complex protein n=1 Tax=Camellia sinensis TaxID=4442 RepID=A0A7J7HK78_CAMSI|nr:hypothetical protein HYC85_010280 [Camellia sinensis]
MEVDRETSPSYFDPKDLSTRERYRRYGKRHSTSSHDNSVSKFSGTRILCDRQSIERRPNAALFLEDIKQEVESFDSDQLEGTPARTQSALWRKSLAGSRGVSEVDAAADSIRLMPIPDLILQFERSCRNVSESIRYGSNERHRIVEDKLMRQKARLLLDEAASCRLQLRIWRLANHTAQLGLRIVQWLEGLASKVLDLDNEVRGSHVGTYLPSSGVWRHTQRALKKGVSKPKTVHHLDFDAPTREIAEQLPDDKKQDESLLEDVWTLLRAGRLEEACDLCWSAGQPWRAATLCPFGGLDLCPSVEALVKNGKNRTLQAIELESGIGHQWRLWKWATYCVSERIAQQDGGKYETAVYAAQCSNLKRILPICTDWESACWAMAKSWLDVQVDLELVRLPPGGMDQFKTYEDAIDRSHGQGDSVSPSTVGPENWPLQVLNQQPRHLSALLQKLHSSDSVHEAITQECKEQHRQIEAVIGSWIWVGIWKGKVKGNFTVVADLVTKLVRTHLMFNMHGIVKIVGDTIESKGFRLNRTKTNYLECNFSELRNKGKDQVTLEEGWSIVHSLDYFCISFLASGISIVMIVLSIMNLKEWQNRKFILFLSLIFEKGLIFWDNEKWNKRLIFWDGGKRFFCFSVYISKCGNCFSFLSLNNMSLASLLLLIIDVQMNLMMGDIPHLLDVIWSWISPSEDEENVFRPHGDPQMIRFGAHLVLVLRYLWTNEGCFQRIVIPKIIDCHSGVVFLTWLELDNSILHVSIILICAFCFVVCPQSYQGRESSYVMFICNYHLKAYIKMIQVTVLKHRIKLRVTVLKLISIIKHKLQPTSDLLYRKPNINCCNGFQFEIYWSVFALFVCKTLVFKIYNLYQYAIFLFSTHCEELVGIYASQLAHHRCIDLFVHMMELRLNSSVHVKYKIFLSAIEYLPFSPGDDSKGSFEEIVERVLSRSQEIKPGKYDKSSDVAEQHRLQSLQKAMCQTSPLSTVTQQHTVQGVCSYFHVEGARNAHSFLAEPLKQPTETLLSTEDHDVSENLREFQDWSEYYSCDATYRNWLKVELENVEVSPLELSVEEKQRAIAAAKETLNSSFSLLLRKENPWLVPTEDHVYESEEPLFLELHAIAMLCLPSGECMCPDATSCATLLSALYSSVSEEVVLNRQLMVSVSISSTDNYCIEVVLRCLATDGDGLGPHELNDGGILAIVIAAGFKGELVRFQAGVTVEILRLDAWYSSKDGSPEGPATYIVRGLCRRNFYY